MVRQDRRENSDKHRYLHKPARQLEETTRGEREAFCNRRVLPCSGCKSTRDRFPEMLRGTSPATTPSAAELPICRNFLGAASLSGAHAHWLWAPKNAAFGRRASGFVSAELGAPQAGASSAFPQSPAGPSGERGLGLRSCGAGVRVSSSSRSGRGYVAGGRAPARSPWRGRGWRWTAASWKG